MEQGDVHQWEPRTPRSVSRPSLIMSIVVSPCLTLLLLDPIRPGIMGEAAPAGVEGAKGMPGRNGSHGRVHYKVTDSTGNVVEEGRRM